MNEWIESTTPAARPAVRAAEPNAISAPFDGPNDFRAIRLRGRADSDPKITKYEKKTGTTNKTAELGKKWVKNK